MSHFNTVLEEIASLDAETDHEQIVQLSCRVDFPSDTAKAIEFALFRTFCVPSIAQCLHRSGANAQERYEQMGSIVSEIVASGCRGERGSAALEHLRIIRARNSIPDPDWIYVLSAFICEPIRWNARFGWRPLEGKEQLALFHLWRAVGHELHIANLPDSLAEFERYNRDYERDHTRPPRPAARQTEPILQVAPGSLRVCVENALRLRGRIATRLVRLPRVTARVS
jgi:hypothetical protein